MRVKTYVFDDVKKGIERLREEFGPDTIILDIKENCKDGSRRTCEISVATKDAGPPQDDPLDFRRRTETIWDHTTKLLIGKIAGLESEIIGDRVKSYPLPLRILFDKMVKNGLGSRLALSIVSEVYSGIGDLAEDSGKANFFLKEAIARRVKLDDLIGSKDSILMLGPSGAGKTQTTKKLAKVFSTQERPVSIVAYDPLKRGGADDLMSFAERCGMPFSFTANEDNLCHTVEKDDRRKIIDLAGTMTSQKRVAERLKDVRKILLLPAGARDEKMKSCSDQFGSINIAGLIFTKIDEEEVIGHICHSLIALEHPVCGLTIGTNAEDIVMPNQETFYKILLEGNLWRTKERRLLQ
jgi:flagellar biosynthesis GTPase FlhF